MKNKILIVAVASVLVLAGAGCRPPELAPGGGERTARGGCSHPYYPLDPGSSITYRMTSGSDVNTMVISVLENSGSEARLQYRFPETDITLDQTVECRGGGLYSQSHVDLASSMTGMRFRTETVSSDGPLIPEGVEIGSEWESAFDMLVHVESGPLLDLGISELNQTLTTQRKAVGRERVTVPAGTFDALKVEATQTIESSGGIPGMGSITFQSTEYWVEGVGYVKVDSTGPDGSASVMEATEIER